MGKDARLHVLKLVRTTFFNKPIRPIVDFYCGGLRKRSHTYEKQMPDNIEYHKKRFQFNKINSAFDNLDTDFLKSNRWVEELGANPFLLGFECGNVYDTRTRKFDLAKPRGMIVKVFPHTKAEVEHVEHSKEKYLRKFFKDG